MTCKQVRQVIKYDDKEIKIYCTVTTKKIAEIRIQFKTISYEDILRKTISTINNQPTEQISNKKKLGCEISKYFQNFVSKYKKEKHSAIDHKKYHFTGYTEWLSVQKTISGKEPKVKLFISSLEKSSSCNYSNDNFISMISLTGFDIYEEDDELRIQNNKSKKENTLNKLFN